MMGRAWMASWPGLAGLWLRGRWLDLAVAAGFCVAVNFALVTTFVWPRLLSRDWPAWAAPLAAWVLVLWFWVVSRRRAARILAQEAAKSLQPDAVSEELLHAAQIEYLKGHWLEAESLLLRLLARRPGDAEALLLVASVYRRSGRSEQARKQLAELSRLPAAERWREEMMLEERKLREPNAAAANEAELVSSPAVSSPQRAI